MNVVLAAQGWCTVTIMLNWLANIIFRLAVIYTADFKFGKNLLSPLRIVIGHLHDWYNSNIEVASRYHVSTNLNSEKAKVVIEDVVRSG